MPDGPFRGASGEPDPVFGAEERFYYRVHPERIQPDGGVDPAHVQCPDLSSNRSKYSEPRDVLIPLDKYGGHAVFRFLLPQIPKQVASESAGGGSPTSYDVKTVHDPLEENYAHCETRLYRGGEHMRSGVSHGAKKVFRAAMSHILELEHTANVPL